LQELADHDVIGEASDTERIRMSAFDSLLVQLKRRHVYRVAVVYAAVGWLLVQIVTQVFPVFSFPTWTEQLAVLVLVGGFPIAVVSVSAWAYELKPDGVHRDPRWIALTRRPEYQRWLAARQRARSDLADAVP
jgi:hypothetical protein